VDTSLSVSARHVDGLVVACHIVSITRHYPPSLIRRRLAHREQIERHDHDQHQLFYPTRGVIFVTTDIGTWVIPPLRAIWLPAGCPHAHAALGPVEVCSLLLHPNTNPLDTDRPTLLHVSPLLREVFLALTATPAPSTGERARLEAVIFDQLDPSPTGAAYLLPDPHDDRLRAIVDILREKPGDPRTLAQLGHAVGASERTLSRLFRAHTGMSFPQWRAQLRLQAALIALTAGTPVGDVAHHCGYSTPSAFIAAFRHAFGTTPGTYLHQHNVSRCPLNTSVGPAAPSPSADSAIRSGRPGAILSSRAEMP
jgi:AraC-like DNA-binding protein